MKAPPGRPGGAFAASGPAPATMSGPHCCLPLFRSVTVDVCAVATAGDDHTSGETSDEDEDKERWMEEVRELEIELVGGEELPEYALMIDMPDDD